MLAQEKDTTKNNTYSHRNKPLTAALLSAALPGAGQAYNKKYWKIPIVWGGLAGLGYWAYTNHTTYKGYKEALIAITDNDAGTNADAEYTQYTTDQLLTIRNTYRRRRDFAMIITGVYYALNIVDATVDAHLSEFDINDKLSLRLSSEDFYCKQQPAISLHIKL